MFEVGEHKNCQTSEESQENVLKGNVIIVALLFILMERLVLMKHSTEGLTIIKNEIMKELIARNIVKG